MANDALRAAYAAAMQEAPPASPQARSGPTPTETPALEHASPPTPGPSVPSIPGPNDLPPIGGIDLNKLNLTPDQVAALHAQTVALKGAPVDPADSGGSAADLSVDNGEPTPIPVRREGESAPRRESRLEEAVPVGEEPAETPPSAEKMLLELVTSDAELSDLVFRKAREKSLGVQPGPATPKRLTADQFAELSHEDQIAYVHQRAVADTTSQLMPVLQRLEAGIRDIKQGEQDRVVIAEQHSDFLALPKDHYIRTTVDMIREAQPDLPLVTAITQAKELVSFVKEGAKREIQAGQARVASTVAKPQTAQTRELALDPRQMKAQGRSRGEILNELFQAEVRKRGVDV